MNPIGILSLAVAVACLPLMAWVWAGRRVERETAVALKLRPVSELDAAREDWDGELAAVGEELAAQRQERARVAALRADTLRGIYLGQVGRHRAMEHEEVPAQ